MNKTLRILKDSILLILASAVLTNAASAQTDVAERRTGSAMGIRSEAWLALPSWPGLQDLQPAAGGSFKQVGYGLGGAAHWPFRKLGNSDLMLGFEGVIMATDSDTPVLLDDLLARHGYLAVSAKWMVGEARNVSLDAGLGYHLVDIAQLDTDYRSSLEFESWEETAVGFFVGATWDAGAGRPGRNSGLSLGLKVHFVDFGTVRDEDVFFTPVLGTDAGELDGPLYEVQIGYYWR